jgi:hypothetical protein
VSRDIFDSIEPCGLRIENPLSRLSVEIENGYLQAGRIVVRRPHFLDHVSNPEHRERVPRRQFAPFTRARWWLSALVNRAEDEEAVLICGLLHEAHPAGGNQAAAGARTP